MNQRKNRKKKLRREGQRVIFSNGEKGWNSSKSELSLNLNKQKTTQSDKIKKANTHYEIQIRKRNKINMKKKPNSIYTSTERHRKY